MKNKPLTILCQIEEEIVLYLISFILQQCLQLLAQHQGAEVRYRYRLRVWPFGTHAILTNNTPIIITPLQPQWPLLHGNVVRGTDRHLLQAAGQTGGRDAMPGSLGVIQALQWATDTVAACQRGPAGTLLLSCCLVLQETQGVRLHRLRYQT